jgi:mannose-6-phosphate isomerase-like protein (cupin superfamily)
MPTVQPALDLDRSYVSISEDGLAEPVAVTPEFWQELTTGRRTVGQWLLGAGESRQSAPTWDLHPHGECIIILLSGSIDVTMQLEDDERVVELRETGDACLVPRGVWHRQVLHELSRRIFLTEGAGTQMRPVTA